MINSWLSNRVKNPADGANETIEKQITVTSGAATEKDPSKNMNEDAVYCEAFNNGGGVVCVADGVGGGKRGDLAAQAIAAAFKESTIQTDDPEQAIKNLKETYRKANKRVAIINNELRIHENERRCAAAFAAAHIVTTPEGVRYAAIIQEGDTRLTIYDENGNIVFETLDHSHYLRVLIPKDRRKEVQKYLDDIHDVSDIKGLPDIERQDLETIFKKRNSIYQAVNGLQNYDEPNIHLIELKPEYGYVVVAESDGSTDNLTRAEREKIIRENKDKGPQAVSDALVKKALEISNRTPKSEHTRPKQDDITAGVLVVQKASTGSKQGQVSRNSPVRSQPNEQPKAEVPQPATQPVSVRQEAQQAVPTAEVAFPPRTTELGKLIDKILEHEKISGQNGASYESEILVDLINQIMMGTFDISLLKDFPNIQMRVQNLITTERNEVLKKIGNPNYFNNMPVQDIYDLVLTAGSVPRGDNNGSYEASYVMSAIKYAFELAQNNPNYEYTHIPSAGGLRNALAIAHRRSLGRS